jgi:type IV secretory pathway VirB6-like protein
MNSKLLKFVMISFVALLLAACGDEPCKRECDENGVHCKTDCGSGLFECVEADDWGYPKIWVPADGGASSPLGDYAEESLRNSSRYGSSLPSSGGNVTGSYPNQTAEPIDSEQILLGEDRPLVITVGRDNQWTSWYGGAPAGSSMTVPNRECQFKVTNGSSPGNIANDLSPSTLWAEQHDSSLKYYLKDGNYYNYDGGAFAQGSENLRGNRHKALYSNELTPCYYRNGMGLYVGLAPDVEGYNASPGNILHTYHIPDSKAPNMINNPNVKGETNRSNREMDGYLVKGATSSELPGAQRGDRLYFKILDNYYQDNAGGYLVRIKEGTRNPKPGPLETITDTLIEPVKTLMRRLYEGIAGNTEFVNIVRALLVLYIVFYGFKFMMGMGSPEELRKDAVIRMIKIGVLVQLISPGSWDFFYNNLFAAFVEGIQQISALLMSPFEDFDPNTDNPWYSMDQLLAKFFSAETNAKILASLFSNAIGFLFVPLLYLTMIIFVKAVLKAVVTYIVAFIGIAILIAMAPIFFVFMLFEPTKRLMEEWFNQLLTFGLQQIILMAVLGMFAAIIVDYMERTIGYRVCWNVWLDVDFPFAINETGPKWYPWHMFDFRFWMPTISNEMANIWMDVNGNGVKEAGEYARRYIDIPYLDPVYDRDVIARYLSERDFLDLASLGLFLFIVWLMMHFVKFVPTMAEELKGGGGKNDSTSVFGAANSLYKAGINSFKQNAGHAMAFGKWGAKWGGKAAQTEAARSAGRKARRAGVGAARGVGRGAEFAADKTGLAKAGKAVGRGAGKLGSKVTGGLTKATEGAASLTERTARAAGYGKAMDLAEKGLKAGDKLSTHMFGGGKKAGGTGADGAGGLGPRGSGAGGLGTGGHAETDLTKGGKSAGGGKAGKPAGMPDGKKGGPKTGADLGGKKDRGGLGGPDPRVAPDTGAGVREAAAREAAERAADARAAAESAELQRRADLERSLAEAADAGQMQALLEQDAAEAAAREARDAALQVEEAQRVAALEEETRAAEAAAAEDLAREDLQQKAQAKKAEQLAHEKAVAQRRVAQLDSDCEAINAKIAAIEGNEFIGEAEKQGLLASEQRKLDIATRHAEAAKARLSGLQS